MRLIPPVNPIKTSASGNQVAIKGENSPIIDNIPAKKIRTAGFKSFQLVLDINL